MYRARQVAWIVAGLLWAVCAQAGTDCKKQSFIAGESARDYLVGYGEECIADQIKAQWAKWEIASADEKQAADFSALVPAWKELATAFERLTSVAPDAGMKGVYAEFTGRARAAGETLRSGLEVRELPDVALFRHDAWRNTKMTVSEYKEPGDPYFRDIDVGNAIDQDCKVPASALCTTTLAQGKEMMLSWGLAARLTETVSAATVQAISKQVAAKDEKWNQYLYDSKPMLPFDFVLTDLFERQWSKSDQYPEGFREPPVRQWFLLHPSFAVEYASAAADGEQLKPVLYLELIGVNYWDSKRRPINAPVLRHFSGASLMVSYADRAGLKDTGVGVLLTFDNVYSIGISRYGSETAVSLSLDLANLYREKFKPRYQEWKGK
jgi:hypothetical protein